MTFNRETNDFINNYVKALKDNNAVVFAGAGLSVDSGFFDWKKLLKPIAQRLDLDIEEEYDLTALAQYFVDSQGGRGELNQILVEQYHKMDVKISNKHHILARLPIHTFWTTNFDTLVEQALFNVGKTPDIKKTQNDLSINIPKRDAIIYKMHGDISLAADTVLTKHEYEDYNKTRELYSNAFKTDFVSKTFLFIGFSFTDPNLDYLISRIRTTVGRNQRPDYYFIKKENDAKKLHRQQVKANSLKQYGLHPIWIDEYSEIETILREIEVRYLRNAVFISGSADIYNPYEKITAEQFLHNLSASISNKGYKIVTGFGLGVGSAIINGVLDNMQHNRNQNLDNYVIMRPFPQIETGSKKLPELWKEYRENFIPLAGIAVFVFGNKNGGKDLANGMEEEFNIAVEKGLKVIPIGATGYMSEKLWEHVIKNIESLYPNSNGTVLYDLFESLNDKSISLDRHIETILNIINLLNAY